MSLKVRLSVDDPRTERGRKLQVIVNDVARIVVKKRRPDHVRDDISIKAGPMVIDLPAVALLLPDYKLSIVGIYRQHHGGAHGPQLADLCSIREIISSLSSSADVCIVGDINLDAGKYENNPFL